MKRVDADRFVKEFPVREENYDRENGNEHFIFGIEATLESLKNTEEIDAVPVKWLEDWFKFHLPRSFWWIARHVIRDWHRES